MKIIVNGKSYEAEGDVSHAAIATMAGYPGDKYLSVTYRGPRRGDVQRSGILSPGQLVALEEGMIFNAARTGNA